MEKEQGVIEKVLENGRAVVRVQQSAHCATCRSRDSCHAAEGRDMLVEVENPLLAKVGDHVEIGVPTTALLKLSILVYFLPIVALLVGAYGGGALASSYTDPTLASVLGGILAMAATFLCLKRFDRRMRGRPDFTPHMIRILISSDPLQPGDSI